MSAPASPPCPLAEHADRTGIRRMHARPTRHRAPSRYTPPARPVRGRPWKTSGYIDRATGTDAVRYVSVDPATPRPTAIQGDTPRETQNGPPSREFPASGPFL